MITGMVFYVANFNYKHVERKLIIIKTINIKNIKNSENHGTISPY